MSITLHAPGWSSPPVQVASRLRDRWRGLKPRGDGRALLLRASSVHGIGMKESLWVVALDEAYVVIATRLLMPGRLIVVPTAEWLVEMSATVAPPPPGAILHPTISRPAGPKHA